MIDTGELLTRGTIWSAIMAYAIGSALLVFARSRSRWLSAVRAAWTIGCISLIAHFITAFHFYHNWSHELAYRDTARQTEEVVGLNWGGGLFINYAVLVGWIVDVSWWRLSGINSYFDRRRWLVLLWHAFLIFIIFNSTVVFKSGIVRWTGLAISLFLFLSWMVIARNQWTVDHVT